VKLITLVSSMVSLLFAATPCWAKQVGEALSDMSSVQDTDPNGFKIMLISIGMIFLVAITLISVTTMYMFKGKKKSKP
jgi:hypothetical protein